MHYIHTWPIPIHNRLIIPEQPYRKQVPGNHWPEYEKPREKTIQYTVPCKLWDMVGPYVFLNKSILCIVDYYSMFPSVKETDILEADDLFKVSRIVFVRFELPMKIISDAGMNFTSDIFRQLCRWMNIKQAIT